MKKQIISNLTSNYALSVVGMTLGFFLVPFLIGKLGKNLYGIIVLTESTIAFFEILTISVRQAMSRHATFAYSQNRQSEFVEYLATSLRILYISALLIASIGIFIAFNFPVLFKVPAGYGGESQWHFFLIAGSFALATLNIPYWSALYAKQRFDLINFSSSFGLIVRAFCIFAFYSLAPKEHQSLIAYGFIFLAMTLVQNSVTYYWYRKLFPGLKLKMHFYRPEKVREILSFSAHTSLIRISGLLYQNTSNILINIFWGPAMNTMYSVTVKLPNILQRIFVEPTWTLTPTLTDLAAKKDIEKTQKLLLAFSKILAIITHPILWTLMFLAPTVIRLWVGPDFSMAGDLLRIYLISPFYSIPITILGSAINAHGKIKLPSYVHLASAVLNLSLCLLLGVFFDLKLYGIVLAFVIMGFSTTLLFYPMYACRVVGLPPKKFYLESLAKPFICSTFFIAGGFVLARALLSDWTLKPALFLIIGSSYALHFFVAHRWLLTEFERKYLRESATLVADLLSRPFNKSAVQTELDLPIPTTYPSVPFIRLERLTVDKDTLQYEFTTSLNVFRVNSFAIRYEGLTPDDSESIRMIPFAAFMAPIAMATGAQLFIPSLDADFAESLIACEKHWKNHFPKWNYEHYRLKTTLVQNHAAAAHQPAVLFSCGLDSMATYLHNRAKKPHLFTILGADIPLTHTDFIRICRDKLFDEFAKKEGVDMTYIHTNIRQAADSAKLKKYAQNWYASVQFGILLTGLTAPISYGRFSKVVLASCSHQPDDMAPCAGDPGIVRQLRWGSTQVEDQLHEFSRVQKIAQFLKTDPSTMKYLRVCWEQFEKVNCSRCKKCLRTICELLVNNVDPHTANFHVDDSTLPELQKKLRAEFHLFFNCDPASINFWREIQQAIDLEKLEDCYGSKSFFAWLKDFRPLKVREPLFVCRSLYFAERLKKAGPSKIFKRCLKLFSRTS